MSKHSDDNLRGIPMKPYDLLREGLIVLAVITGIVVVMAVIYGSPDYPTVRGEDVANDQPILYLKTVADLLEGNSSIDGYGPPYTSDYANAATGRRHGSCKLVRRDQPSRSGTGFRFEAFGTSGRAQYGCIDCIK